MINRRLFLFGLTAAVLYEAARRPIPYTDVVPVITPERPYDLKAIIITEVSAYNCEAVPLTWCIKLNGVPHWATCITPGHSLRWMPYPPMRIFDEHLLGVEVSPLPTQNTCLHFVGIEKDGEGNAHMALHTYTYPEGKHERIPLRIGT